MQRPRLLNCGELEEVTELARVSVTSAEREDGQWQAVFWEDAGEATVYRYSAPSRTCKRKTRTQDGGSRARRSIRRYALANGLDSLLTLTFRNRVADHGEVVQLLRRALAETRKRVGGSFAYVRVIESHKNGHGLHVHLLVEARAASALARSWKHGFVHQRRYETRDGIRRGAAYVSKTFDGERGGQHRYEVAQGFRPIAQRIQMPSRDDVWRWLTDRMGHAPSRVLDFLAAGWAVWIAWWDELTVTRHASSRIRGGTRRRFTNGFARRW